MHRMAWHSFQFLVGILLAAICVQGQDARSSVAQVQGFDFVAQVSADGEVRRVYLFGGSAHAACLEGETGHVIWSIRAPGLASQASPGVGPIIADSTLVYMGGGGFFTAYGLDLQTGKTKWTLDKRSPALAAGQHAVYLSTQGGLGVIAVDAETGKIKWEHRALKVGGTLTNISYSGDHLYTDSSEVWNAFDGHLANKLSVDPDVVVASAERVFMAGDRIPLFALNAQTGETVWKAQNPLSSSPRTPHYVYLAASSRYVVAAFYDNTAFDARHGVVRVYEAGSGRLLWEKAVSSETGLLPAPVSADNEFVYLLEPGEKATENIVTALNGGTGEQMWTYVAKRLNGPVAPAGDAILISSDEGPAPEYTSLYALDRKTGSVRWKFSF